MADIADSADEVVEAHLRCALAIRKPVEPRRGVCLWCDDACTGSYCSAECRDDHRQWLRRQN